MLLSKLETIFRSLNEAEVRYLVVGGLAVAAHGHARATHDLDLVVALDEANARKTVQALQTVGLTPSIPVQAEEFCRRSARERWVREKNMLVFPMRGPNPLDPPVDLFVVEPFDFAAAYARALPVEFAPGITVPVVPLDALIAMKNAAGRPQDLEDIRILTERRDHPPPS